MKLRNYLLVSTFLVLLAAGLFVRAGNDSKEDATVVGIVGEWRLEANFPDCPAHKQGQKDPNLLHFLNCFYQPSYAVGTGTGSSLVILIGKKATTYNCNNANDHPHCTLDHGTCRCLIDASGQSSGGFLAAILPLFRESPARYITPVSRGLEAEVVDSVVPLQGDRVDLAPAFQEMDPGAYHLRLESLSGSVRATAPLQLQWSGSGPATVSAAGIQLGLYRLVRLAPNGDPAGQDAWVLVSSPDRFVKDSAAFQSAVEATKKWPDDVDARAPRAVLRAYLDSLSRQAQKEQ